MSNSRAGSALSADSYTPLYRQLASLLREDIGADRYSEGDQLPSENELVRDHGVSRATAIAALDELVQSNVAYRVRGRGTFVAKPFLRPFSLSTSFSENTVALGMTPTSVTRGFDLITPEPRISAKLGVDDGLECYRLERLRLADGEPVALQTAYLPALLYPGLSKEMFESASLYDVMRNGFSRTPVWAEAIVEAGRPTAEEATALEIAADDPILIVWHLSLDSSIQGLEYVRSVYRADRFSFASGRQSLSAIPG